MLRIPHLIAICGYPGSGKTEVQNILAEIDVLPVDDGAPVRDFAMRHLGLTRDQTHTQEGKAENSDIAGVYWNNRTILGELANRLEEMFGPHIMPYMATRTLFECNSYSFGSVRRDQGWFYKSQGGIVIGVRRPGVGPSGNEFDEFDFESVDFWIDNDGTVEDLRFKIEIILQSIQELSTIKWAA